MLTFETEILKLTLELKSAATAACQIESTGGGFGLHTENVYVHYLGFPDAPLFGLYQPTDPDDEWIIKPRTGGRYLVPSAPSPLYEELRAWLGGRRALHLPGLLAALPSGHYSIIRTRRRPIHSAMVQMGNTLVPALPSIDCLLQTEADSPDLRSSYINIIGSVPDAPPDLASPLLGVAILNAAVSVNQVGVFLFPCWPPPSDPSDSEELVLVLPQSGPLILDNLDPGQRPVLPDSEALLDWQKQLLPRLEHRLQHT